MHIGRPISVLSTRLGLVAALSAGLVAPGLAADWYVAPLTKPPTSAAPSGSEASPFASVDAAFKSGKIKGGDRILLKDGPHGSLVLKNAVFDSEVTIMSQTGTGAQFDDVLINDSRKIRLRNLSVWPTDPATAPAWLVLSGESSPEIVVEGLVVRSEQGDEAKFAAWDAAKWEARKFGGIKLNGPDSTAVGNNLMGIAAGIFLIGDNSTALDNVISFYNGDGLRGLGDNSVFRRNKVFNCIHTDENHADGFQSYAGPSGTVVGLVLDSNIIIEWNHPKKDHPLRCKLQGIGLFDGFYDNLTIINNLVTTTQYHGISIYGARKAVIANNTVANTDHLTGPHPYIGVRNHKNGSLASGVLVANNVAMSFTGSPDMGSAVEYRNNSVIGTPGAVFENPFAFDYRPKATSGFLDTADAASATPVDILGKPRPSGKGPDRGAYEVASNGTTGGVVPPTESAPAPGPIASGPVAPAPVKPAPVKPTPVKPTPVVKPPIVKEPAAKPRQGRTVAGRVTGSLTYLATSIRGRLSRSNP